MSDTSVAATATDAAADPGSRPATLRTATGREAARWVAGHLAATPWLTTATVASTVGGALLAVLPTLLLGRIVDGVVEGRSRSVLLGVGIAIVAAALAGAVVQALSTYLIGRLGAEMLARLREGAVRCVLGMPAARVEQVGRGDVLSRVGDDVAVISKGMRQAIPTMITSVVLVGIATVGMFGLDWRLGLAGACGLPMYVVALRWYLPRSAPLYRRQREAQAERAQALISGLDGIATVRAHRLEGAFRAEVDARSWRVRDLGVEVFRYFGRFVGRENRAEFVGLSLIVVVGYLLLDAGLSTLGQVSATALLFHRLFNPLGMIMFTFDEAQKSGASLARLVGVLSESDGERLVRSAASDDGEGPDDGAGYDDGGGPPPVPVAVRGVTFTYPGTERAVLHDVDLEIPAGTSLALVGATGAGKTTLAALVAGVGSPQDGSVRIGGQDLAGLDEADARVLVSILTQEAHVFAGTLTEDLRLAAPGASDARLGEALRTVGADGWVAALPDGLDTVVGAGGEQLDVTRAAQVALARLVLGRSPVVVLDESTAEAGSQGAAELERAALAACRGRTTLLVAHRLTQAMAADRVAVLDAGRIVEQGTHEELVALGGRYARLWTAWRRAS